MLSRQVSCEDFALAWRPVLYTLLFETIAITLSTMICAMVPTLLGAKGQLPRGLLPLATGTMTGLCLFGLLPEAGKEGGALSLGLAVVVAAVYSLVHLRHLIHHADEAGMHHHGESAHDVIGHSHGSIARSLAIVVAAIFVHSLLDGALLVITTGFSVQAAAPVTISLGIHKAFEALSLSALITSRSRNPRQARNWLLAYIVSFPCGVAVAAAAREFLAPDIMQRLALMIMSVALGSLIGCLIFDFVMPSLSRCKQYRDEALWLVGGVAAASFILWRI